MLRLALVLVLALFFAPSAYAENAASARGKLAVVVSAGTALSISGSAANDVAFESRDGRPGSGYELDARLEWHFAHGYWTFGPTAGFTYQYLRTAALSGDSYTQGSVTVYSPWVGAFARYDLTGTLDAPWDVTGIIGVGHACVDLHDQITNGTDCEVVRPHARVELTYRGNDWVMQPGVYVAVATLVGIDGKGEPGRRDVTGGHITVVTSGLLARF